MDYVKFVQVLHLHVKELVLVKDITVIQLHAHNVTHLQLNVVLLKLFKVVKRDILYLLHQHVHNVLLV